jgi:serine/threonine protein kinase
MIDILPNSTTEDVEFISERFSENKFVNLDIIDIVDEVVKETPNHRNSYLPTNDRFIQDLSPLAIRTDFQRSEFDKIYHICNGSHSHIHKSEYENNIVILKVLAMTSADNEVARREFDREIKFLSRMNHTNLVKIYGSGTVIHDDEKCQPRSFIVLEALPGDTLSYHLSLKKSPTTHVFTCLRYLRIGKEFASALNYIHHQVHPDYCFIHRDLKPDNVGFTLNGTLKLMDFGLCTVVPRSGVINEVYDLTGFILHFSNVHLELFFYDSNT